MPAPHPPGAEVGRRVTLVFECLTGMMMVLKVWGTRVWGSGFLAELECGGSAMQILGDEMKQDVS